MAIYKLKKKYRKLILLGKPKSKEIVAIEPDGSLWYSAKTFKKFLDGCRNVEYFYDNKENILIIRKVKQPTEDSYKVTPTQKNGNNYRSCLRTLLKAARIKRPTHRVYFRPIGAGKDGLLINLKKPVSVKL